MVVPNRDAVGPEAEAAAALLIAVEPALGDIGNQKDREPVAGIRVKRVRLPRVYRDPRGLIDAVRDLVDGDDGRRAAEVKGQMAFAMSVRAHRSVELVHRHPAKRAMTHRQGGTHTLSPNVLPRRTLLFYLWD